MEASIETIEISLLDRISKIEESLKDLKRAARHELKARRRRRGSKKEGVRKDKGETPAQLKPWHTEVRNVWDELKTSDPKTPYKRAVAEASLRRSDKTVSAKPAVVEKKVSKKAAKTAEVAVVAVAAPVKTEEVKVKAEKKSKKATA